MFEKNGHQDSYWKEFSVDTENLIARSVIGYRGSKLESHVREYLLSPVLHTITRRMALLPETDCINFEAFLQPEASIRLRGVSGKPASVDYVISLESNNSVLKSIPVEAKKDFSTAYLIQLASYMNKLSTCGDSANTTLVGLLITEDTFHIMFALYTWRDTCKTVPFV